ncbi:MAG: MFS transporter [Saprospirales bacterium]|jgi:UMF1 family MFS transporter|nr:MFS transporter [Saprospirales bacterium]
MPTLNNPRTIRAWAFFDWANSSYALVIAVAIFPAYYSQITSAEINMGSFSISSSGLHAFSISGAYLLIALFSPFLSGIADYGGKKKWFMRFFTTMGSLACISMFFFTAHANLDPNIQPLSQVLVGTISFMLATIGFAGALVFYNAFLPEIATEDQYDRVSAKGFSFGYFGSVILLVVCLLAISFPQWFGLPEEGALAVRLSFVAVGLWWLGFAQIPFRQLPADKPDQPIAKLITKGYRELRKTWKIVRKEANMLGFLASFFFYSAGVQTVLFLAATFAEEELDFQPERLILIILVLQLVAIPGAFTFARLSEKRGNKFALVTLLLIWSVICIGAYFVETDKQFYVIAASVGLVMGGIQSLSRSTYSKLMPEGTQDTASFFSFYDILEKLAIVLGTFTFGFIEQITGGMHNSILALVFFFLVGLVLLITVRIKHSVETEDAVP